MLQVAWETVKSRTQIQLSCGKKRPKAVPSERATSSPACDDLRQKNAYLHLLGSQTETAWYAEQRVVCRPLQFGEPRLYRFCLISNFDWTFWLQRCTILFGVLEILEYAMSSVAFCLLGKTCEKTICKQANHLNALCILHLCILNTSRKNRTSSICTKSAIQISSRNQKKMHNQPATHAPHPPNLQKAGKIIVLDQGLCPSESPTRLHQACMTCFALQPCYNNGNWSCNRFASSASLPGLQQS